MRGTVCVMVCRRCNDEKGAEFDPQRRVCRDCRRTEARERMREATPDPVKRAAWLAANKERNAAKAKAWKEANADAVRKHKQTHYALHREAILERRKLTDDREAARARVRAWRAANPEAARRLRRMSQGSRRARERGAFIEHVDAEVVYAMHGGRCGICGGFIQGDFHVDHVTALARGGKHGYINVQPAHPRCNLRKGAGFPVSG